MTITAYAARTATDATLAPAWAARLLSDPLTLARHADYAPEVRAVAVWVGESGSTYTWPQALTDNRPARVLARIERFGMEAPVPGTLRVIPRG
jgi:hypothetical protein